MVDASVDALLLSVGADLPWLCGYEAMPLERLTMLVVPNDGAATLVVPRLEAARVTERSALFSLRPWDETEDPVAIVSGLVGRRDRVAIGDHTWARFLIDLQSAMPSTTFTKATEITGPLRMRKDGSEVEALRRAAHAADRVATRLRAGEIELAGRTEAEVSAELGRQLLDEGHDRVNFSIVATGGNAASPHHHPGPTVIAPGDLLLCDFGGTMAGYCSDITRCISLGEPSAEVAEAYAVLHAAQQAAVAAATVGTSCSDVDAVARRRIAEAGWGDRFIHRTGHGIGVEAHEDPYIVSTNSLPLAPGHAFSIEPGIYVDDRWGMRLEDIVVATDDGPDVLNRAGHDLAVI